MSDVRRVVETVFKVQDLATAKLAGMAGYARSASAVLGRMTGTVAALGGALGGAFMASGWMDIHQNFEDTQIAIGGMMNALGVSGTFEQGLRDAERAMESITAAAAALPGEAEDYVRVFQAALPQIRGALADQGVDQWTKLSNDITAAGITFGVSSRVIGRHLSLLLRTGRGGATASMATFQKLLPFMRQVEGQAALTGESFNRMTEQQRVKLLSDTMEKLGPMLRASAQSMSAVRGALASTFKLMLRKGTQPLFDQAKVSMAALNEALVDSNGHLRGMGLAITDAATKLSTYLVAGFKMIPPVIARARRALAGLNVQGRLNALRRNANVQELGGMARRAGAGLGAIVQNRGVQQLLASGLARAVLGPVGMLAGPLVQAAINTDSASRALELFYRIAGPLGTLFSGVMVALGGFNMMLTEAFTAILPPLFDALGAVLVPLLGLFNATLGIVMGLALGLWPYVQAFFAAVGNLISAIGSVLGPAIRIISFYLQRFFGLLQQHLFPIITRVWEYLTRFVNAVAMVLRRLGRWLGQRADALDGGVNGNTGGGGAPVTIEDAGPLGTVMASVSRAVEAARTQQQQMARMQQRQAASGARGGHHTHNDFRNSRFDITQQFAEGFDPDRIAVAFSQDLEAMSNAALQSGFAPLYTVR